jgi:hypothetical protein
MRDFFSKHGECMTDRDTIHIPDNFSRRKIYNLYKGYVESVEGNGNFITYAYFTRIWKKQFNNVCIPKKSRMGICSICATLKSRRDKSEGAERGMYLLFCFFLIEYLSTMKTCDQYFHFMSCAYSIVKALQEHRNQ